MHALLPKRADPAAGALIGTFVLAALLAPPVLALALIVWLARARRRSSLEPEREVDPEFSARFHEMEESILKAGTVDSQSQKRAVTRPRGSRTGRRVVRKR